MDRGKKVMLCALLMVTVMLISGCGGSPQGSAGADGARIIQTYGEAELMAAPDSARISFAVETRSRQAADAAEENASLATAVREALLNYGLEEEDLTTGSYSLYSYREWFEGRPGGGTEVQTFQAVNEIIVKTDRLEDVGEIVDTAVRAGANTVNYISFELDDPQDLLMQALAAATKQAKIKAEAIAGESGERVRGTFSVREERADYIPFKVQERAVAEDMGMGSATPITPDDVAVRATVVAEFTF